MDCYELDEEEPVAHSSPKPELQRRSGKQLGSVPPPRLHALPVTTQTTQQDAKQLQETAVQLFPWVGLPFDMGDVQRHPLVVQPRHVTHPYDGGGDQHHDVEEDVGVHIHGGPDTSMSLARQMVVEEDSRPPSLPAPVPESVSTPQGCDSAPSTPVSPDTTSLTPSASFDSLDAWPGHSQAIMTATCHSQAKTPESQDTDGGTNQSKPRPKKRSRMQYSEHQVSALEAAFSRNRYPTRQERDVMHQHIGLPPEKIKTWFQNRRSREKRNMLARLQQQQQQQQQHLTPGLQQYEEQLCGKPESAGGATIHGLQHHSQSSILTAASYPGGMVRFLPGQYPVHVSQDYQQRSTAATNLIHSQKVTKKPEASVVPQEPGVAQCLYGRPPVCAATPGFPDQHLTPSPSATSTVVSPPLAQYRNLANPGLFRHSTVSPTSVYNPGITYPFAYTSPAGCYPYWMNYPVPGVAYAAGSSQDGHTVGMPRQWTSTVTGVSPPADDRHTPQPPQPPQPPPWSGQFPVGCTSDWLQGSILQCPMVTTQRGSAAPPPAPALYVDTARQDMQYPRKEFRGLVSASCADMAHFSDGRGTPSPAPGPGHLQHSTTVTTRSIETIVAGRSGTDHFMGVDTGNMDRFSPIRREYNLSPYLCYPSRDGTPTKSMTDCSKSEWLSPLNTPETRSLDVSQASSRMTSPVTSSLPVTVEQHQLGHATTSTIVTSVSEPCVTMVTQDAQPSVTMVTQDTESSVTMVAQDAEPCVTMVTLDADSGDLITLKEEEDGEGSAN